MPNQRAIAAVAGVTQAAVSKALRGDRSIPAATRQRIEKIAHDLGYHPNVYVSSLMAHIRSGRPLRDRGCLALLRSTASEKQGMGHAGGYAYQLEYEGVRKRAEELGFTTECFFLKSPTSPISQIDRVLRQRGINGIILMASDEPECGLSKAPFSWSEYAVTALAYSWSPIAVDSVSAHHRHNLELVFREVLARGYKRIGMCLPPEGFEGQDCSWRERYLFWREKTPPKNRVPLFVGKPGLTPLDKFARWLKRWKPDVIVGLIGHEKMWLDELGISLPRDIGMACVNRPPGSELSGVEENLDVIGSAVVETVVARIERNEMGLPTHPKLVLIEGKWVDGTTLAQR